MATIYRKEWDYKSRNQNKTNAAEQKRGNDSDADFSGYQIQSPKDCDNRSSY